jgi:MoxR-like ATPase
VKGVIRDLLAADVPVMLWGAPGTGKTALVNELARDCGAHLEVLIGSVLDPIDIGGYLVPHDGKVSNIPPPWAQRLKAAESRPCWVFFDELSCAPATVQAALLRVIAERKVGEFDLDFRVIAASNPADTAADGGTLAAATANRFAHIDYTPNAEQWVIGESTAWGLGHISARSAAASAEVAEFIRRNPALLLQVPAAMDDAAGRAWPSPRTWSYAARALAQSGSTATLAPLLGAGAAAEFATWRANRDLPDPEDLLSGKSPLPKRADYISAALMSVVSAVSVQRADRTERILSAWRLLGSSRADQALIPARALLDISPSVPDFARGLGERIIKARHA